MPDSLILSTSIDAPPETIFRFLSSRPLVQKWMGPAAANCAPRESNPGASASFDWNATTPPTTVTISILPGPAVELRHDGLTPAQQAELTPGWTYCLSQLKAAAINVGYTEALPAAVDNYIRAWNETAPAAIAERLDQCWEDDAVFQDAMGSAAGRVALANYIAHARQFVPGFQLELAAPPENCNSYYRFTWIIRKPDGGIMGRGTNFGQLSPKGRFQSAVGFWDKA